MEKFMKEFTLERLEDLKFDIDNGNMVYVDDIHHELYNTIHPFDYTEEAKEQLLEYDIFKAMDKVISYEKDNFGELYTDIADPKRLAGMLVYVLGEEFLFNADIHSIGGEFVTDEHIDHLVENIDCIG